MLLGCLESVSLAVQKKDFLTVTLNYHVEQPVIDLEACSPYKTFELI